MAVISRARIAASRSRSSGQRQGVRKRTPPTEHDRLVALGARWLKGQGFPVVLKELVTWNTTGEVPDVIGWRATACVLIECKTSRADFRADLKKPFRVSPASGMGDWRFYLCPQGLIEADEVPERWGLLWAHEGRVKPIVGVPRGNMSWHSAEAPFRGHKESENAMLVSALRRLGQKGLLNFE